MNSGAGIALSMGLMNVAVYGFTIVCARELGPRQYSALASMASLQLVISVASLGLQATAARRVAAEPEHVAQIERRMRRLVWQVALVLGGVLLLATPLIDRALRLDNLLLASLTGVAAVPLTLMGGYAGILQGERRWKPLSAVYVSNGVPRLLIGASLLVFSPTALAAMTAVTIAGIFPALIGWLALRGGREVGPRSHEHSNREILRETFLSSQALLAFFALSNIDIIVARNALPDHEAGLYAGGMIMAKMLMFLPQFVVVVAFPSMSDSGARSTRPLTISLAAVSAVGIVVTAGVAVAAPLALAFVGGAEYVEIRDDLWAFALLGTLLALIQLLVYAVLARRGQRSSLLVWAALAAMVVGGIATESVTGMLTWVITVDVLLLVTLIAISYLLVNRDDDTPEDTTTPALAHEVNV